jgi:hypothetical protein
MSAAVGIAGIDHDRERLWAPIAHPSRARQASFAHPAQLPNPFGSDVDSVHLRDMSLMRGVEDQNTTINYHIIYQTSSRTL